VQWGIARVIVHKVGRVTSPELADTYSYYSTADDYDTGIFYPYNLSFFSSFHNKFFC